MNDVNQNNFEAEVEQHTGVVLVDVYGPTCGPCKVMAPKVNALAKDMEGKVKVVGLNADENSALVQQLGVRGLPTFLVYANGVELRRKTGSMSAAQLEELVSDLL